MNPDLRPSKILGPEQGSSYVSHQQRPLSYADLKVPGIATSYGPLNVVPQLYTEQRPDTAEAADATGAGPSRSRLRVSKACDRCRAQKIKCSGTYPCTTCTKHMKDCVYNSVLHQSNKKTRPVEHQNTPSLLNVVSEKELPYLTHSEDKNYIRHLENRIQYLESRLGNSANNLSLNLKDGENENETSARFLNPTSKWRYSNRYQLMLAAELCNTIYAGLSEENRQKVVLPRQQYFGWNLSGTSYLSPEPLPELPTLDLPDPISYYIDYFFNEINTLFAIIHETVFRQQLLHYNMLVEEINREPGSDQKDSKTNKTKLFQAMFYLMIVLGIRFTEFKKKLGPDLEMLKMEEKMFKASYRIVSILSFEWESFELIQCWLLISLYLRVTHRQSSSYSSLGYAISMSKAMGLSRRNEKHRIPGTKYESLKAKRIFWSAFIMERLFGLQSGRYGLLNEHEIELDYPSRDFKAESQNDSWITMPSFVLIHVARIATFVHSAAFEKLDIVKYQQINKEIVALNSWMNTSGFNNNEIFNNPKEEISSLVKAQVKLHYYDTVLCIHSKILFNFVGKRIATPGLKIEMVLDSCINIVEILTKVHKANLLYVPWYINLLLLFNVGINLLTLISAGLYLPTARPTYEKAIGLVIAYKKVTVKDENKKVVVKKRFKMAEECLWALKAVSKLLYLRFEEDLRGFHAAGIEPGNADVNKQTFTQYGKVKESDSVKGYYEDPDDDIDEQDNAEFYQLFHNGVKKRKVESKIERPVDMQSTSTSGESDQMLDMAADPIASFGSNEVSADDGYGLYNNLTWFDQWLDTDFDFNAPAPANI